MTISLWRYSHLALAVSSFLFIALASVTGIILSFKPVAEKIQPYKSKDFYRLNVAQLIPTLQKSYTDIADVTIDANQFVKVNGTDSNEESGNFYVDPKTGKSFGKVAKENEFFRWTTTLHRSLFLHELGRLFVGITAFLLFLIATSGTVLIIQRQRSLKKFFGKIVKDGFAQYYHVVLGRLLLIPIIIISLSGTYLSLQRFGIIKEEKITYKIDFDALKTNPAKSVSDFEVFKNIPLSDLQSIEFPFSEDVEDYFTLKLSDREITVNQITGEIITQQPYSKATIFNNLSMDLHTGRGSAIWAIFLAIASANILFFIYSGFVIWWKRSRNGIKNKYKFDQAEYILLVGSENGSTFRFANAIQQQLLKNGKSAFMAELNDYNVYPKAEHILIFAATYGQGDAPTNASKFKSLLKKHKQLSIVDFSVVAFGSQAYPDFCKFGYEVNNALAHEDWAKPLLEIHTVNDRSPEDFMRWANLWAQTSHIELSALDKLLAPKPAKTQEFQVVDKTVSSHEDTSFIIRLKPLKKTKFTSGDLLAVYPANDHRERLYSIGKMDKDVQLSVKLHQGGLGSGFLHDLKIDEKFRAAVVKNTHFHFPAKAKTVIMVSNGTGIAPFLGMIDQQGRVQDIHLYCGFRNKASFTLYENAINKEANLLTSLHVAYSREGEKQYVKDLLLKDQSVVCQTLRDNGVIMLCGSLSMQKDVIELLDQLCQQDQQKSISYYQSRGQILMDCY
ncbi:PepSY domain-containing protein [Pedobacter sp. MC2016-05]|uniref:PepSY domain-containing protein n=1 Tax=Pedobacter sp. MC2016-05 TaxID=2994474 RepID=UPI0022463AA9|nr:PepSY domain-containing protein [Pedobacter sp. MC2016-05]MCX2473905.1 PepSY domain-containing protein [Pedobacter sp. MC2016-05]